MPLGELVYLEVGGVESYAIGLILRSDIILMVRTGGRVIGNVQVALFAL